MSTKQRIIEARKNIRRKLQALRTGQISREMVLQETFKPITDTIERVATTAAATAVATTSDPVGEFVKGHRDVDLDRTYGVIQGRMGSQPIEIAKDWIRVGGREFEPTHGLMNLIFLKKPAGYSSSELKTYIEILRITNAHLTSTGRIKNPRTYKYKNIIQPALGGASGSGVAIDINHKEVTTAEREYIYFDDINEIVDRLRLLIASTNAGNTSHRNEIVSIISELRERGVIDGASG